MSRYNCPDCKLDLISCDGCPRLANKKEESTPFPWNVAQVITNKSFFPDACGNCSNNPKNGGSGICNCTIPYMASKYTTGGTE